MNDRLAVLARTFMAECPTCMGSGHEDKHPGCDDRCPECHGRREVEAVRATDHRGAVGERDALRMTLHNVGAWLSSGNFAGWEMVVSEIEATLNHPGGQ